MRHRVYIAGPYTAHSIEKRNLNIANADSVGREVLALGYAPIVPHNLTQGWESDKRFRFEDFIESDLSLLSTCQLLVLCGDWRHSKGTQAELLFARENGIPIFYNVKDVPEAAEFTPDTTTRAIKMLQDRRRIGMAEYGQTLRPWNGRDSMQDAVEETADMLCYLLNGLAELGNNGNKIPH